MAKIDKYFFDIGHMDTLASQQTFIHRLDPRAKLITTLVFITTVVSFDKYDISALFPFFIYPVFLCAVGNVPPLYLLKKLILVSPFVIMIGIFNPLIDREILVRLGDMGIAGGWISFASILIRFVLTVGAALTLIAVTGFYAVCAGLEKLGTPKVFVVQLMFLYRYLFVLVDEASRMVRARSLRALGDGGAGIKTYGSLVGHLLLRSMDRAQRIYLAMCCRGFDGHIRIMKPLKFGLIEIGFICGWSALFIILRFYNIPMAMGGAVTELFK
jgi:cobalt/nickel transport system permease protein